MQFLSVFGQNGGFLACSWDATQYTTPQRHVADETGTNYLPRDGENALEIENIHISSPNDDIFSLHSLHRVQPSPLIFLFLNIS